MEKGFLREYGMFNWKTNIDYQDMRIPTTICHLPEASPFSLFTIFNIKVHKAPKVKMQEAPYVAKFPVVSKFLSSIFTECEKALKK
jgi:hypothetical protein